MHETLVELAVSLLRYLRGVAVTRNVNKFNVIGRSGRGEFELSLGRELTSSEKQDLIWVWDELKHLRLIQATGTDLVNPDDWVVVSGEGLKVGDSEMARLLRADAGPGPESKRLDGLLQIPDRGEFDKALAVPSVDGVPHSLIMIDLDHFKSINDDFGHPVGDEVLRAAANVTTAVCAGKGEVYRYGGEELAVLLRNYSLVEAAAVAERIRESIENLELSSIDRPITASLGVSSFPDVRIEDLLVTADAALYRSKEAGRNRVTLAKPSERKVKSDFKRKGMGSGRLELRVHLDLANRDNYLLNIENHSDSQIWIEQIGIEQDGIALCEPVRAKAEDNWMVEPKLRRHVSWRPAPNPADGLVHLHSNEGIQFNTSIELVLLGRRNGQQSQEYRQKLAVLVLVTKGELKALAG